jgi:tetratricopeptide (TPR) repeat protein
MRDSEATPIATAEVADSRTIATVSPAIAMIDEGNALEEQGRSADAMARYDAAVKVDPRCARAHLNRGNVLLAVAQIDEARRAYQLAIACDPHYAAAHFNLGNLSYRAGEFERAVYNYQAAIAIKPDFADAFVALGNALDDLGRTSEAVESYECALAMNPGDARIHFNLGVLAFTAGQQEQAEASLRRALSIAPESEDILQQLAIVLVEGHKPLEALQLLMRSLESAPTWTIKKAFASCVARVRFVLSDSQIRAALTAAVTEPWAIPFQLCRPVLSLIMLDPMIASRVLLVNERWPERLPKAELFGAQDLPTLAADNLLHAMLLTAPVSTIEFERFLTAARHALLQTATTERPPDPSDIAALPFYAALARQCFINEYIFACGESELAEAAACRRKLLDLLAADAAVPPLLLLAVAAYFPLYGVPERDFLLSIRTLRLTACCANRSASRSKSRRCAPASNP